MLTEKKFDSSKNGTGVERAMEQQRKREQKLRPLRINAQTIILVPRGKCNKKYADEYRNQIKRASIL